MKADFMDGLVVECKSDENGLRVFAALPRGGVIHRLGFNWDWSEPSALLGKRFARLIGNMYATALAGEVDWTGEAAQ